MEKYDEFLGFDLPKGYCIVEGVNDDGDPWYNVKAGKGKDDDGEDTYEESLAVNKADYEDSPFAGGWNDPGFSLDGDFETYVTVGSKEMSLLIFTVNVYLTAVWIKKGDHVYSLVSNKVIRDDETMNNWVEFLNNVLASLVIDGEKGNFEKLTADKLTSESTDVDEAAAQNSDIPYAKPNEGQHTHLDFLNKTKSSMSLFGGLLAVNQTGTEYSFQSIAQMADECDSSEMSSIYEKIAEADTKKFELEETAHDMAELFRVNVEVFDGGHDREQEILGGYIQRAAVYNKLRSFAWTFAAFCDKEGMDPAAVDFETIQEIVDYINTRDGLNYVADSFSPNLCSGDDLHVYYVPDSVADSIKSKLLKLVNSDSDDDNPVQVSEIRSLDGLRNELSYMYPAIKAIYDELEATRDRDEALLEGVCDILYAWCSMAYAAREPIFSEDGPMNCWWEHPDNEEDWETKWKIEQLEEGIKQEKEWIKQHSKDLSRNTPITFKDKTFVFTGVDGLDEWLDILQKLTNLGGLERGAVSGKTNYLVCNPMYAGESKVKHALEQRIKGKDVKIVLFEDFLKAIKMTVKSPQEQLAELKASKEKKPVEKHIKPVVRPEVVKKEKPENFTYNNGIVAKGEGYSLVVPDGFVIKEGVEDRAFVAYIPNDEDPDDYLESRFIIFAGQKQENEIFGQLRTVAEFTSIIQGMSGSVGAAFTDCKVDRYERKDLPGAIIYGYDPGCLHANAYVGIDDYMQTMRVQISDVNRRNKAGYEEIVKEIFDHMTADKPVQLLKPLDAEEYVAMSADSKAATEWADSITEYVNHISLARNVQQNGIVSSFQQQQENGNANVAQLKKDIKSMLHGISKYAEAELIKAEAIYTLKRAQYPENRALKKMESAIEALIELADQEVNLDEENIKVTSELATEVKKRMKKSVVEVIDILVKNASGEFSSAVIDALSKAKAENEKAIKAAEEARKKAEEERKRAEAEERARKEEEKRKAEEARKKAEAEAKAKREEELRKYNEAHVKWERDCETVKNQRAAFVDEKIAEEKKSLEAAATSKRDAAVAAVNATLKEQTERKATAESTLASLGMFKFGEKKNQKAIIEDATKRISDAQSAISSAESTYRTEMSEVVKKAENKAIAFRNTASKEFPMPDEPKKPV